MKPKEAADVMRLEADHMMQMIRGLRARKSSDFSQKDLLNWLCIALQQHSDFKMAMADILNNVNLPELMSETTQAVYQQTEEAESINMEAPPFDKSFWLGLGDV